MISKIFFLILIGSTQSLWSQTADLSTILELNNDGSEIVASIKEVCPQFYPLKNCKENTSELEEYYSNIQNFLDSSAVSIFFNRVDSFKNSPIPLLNPLLIQYTLHIIANNIPGFLENKKISFQPNNTLTNGLKLISGMNITSCQQFGLTPSENNSFLISLETHLSCSDKIVTCDYVNGIHYSISNLKNKLKNCKQSANEKIKDKYKRI